MDIYIKNIKFINEKDINEIKNHELLTLKNKKIGNNLKEKYDISIEFITELYKLLNIKYIKINNIYIRIIKLIYNLLNNTCVCILNKDIVMSISTRINILLSKKYRNNLIDSQNSEIIHLTIAFANSFNHFLRYYLYLVYNIKIPFPPYYSFYSR